jgi:transcriptional regulator with XRE-family HTH domain
MYFEELHGRLLLSLRMRLSNGELTERRLARLTGISQPHVHNVLKGKRILSPRAADQILHRLGLSILDLLRREESARSICSACEWKDRYVEVPVLEGWLGPGLPLPKELSKVESYPFPKSYVVSMEGPVVARLAPDALMPGLCRANDLALLDRSHSKRLRLEEEACYVVSRYGEGVIRRLQVKGADLLLLTIASPGELEGRELVRLEGGHLLDFVKARVTWIGRSM